MGTKPKLRVREIAFALGAGVLAAGTAAAVLSDGHEPERRIEARSANLTYEVAPFAELSVVGPHDVIITIGDQLSVRSEGNAQALAAMEVVVEDGELKIQPREQFSGRDEDGDEATFYITVPRLESIALAGSGTVRLDRAEGQSFNGSVVGSGELAIGMMKIDKADFNMAGSGNLIAAGTAREVNLAIVGSGDVEAGELSSQTASVSLGGSGDARLLVARDASVSMMGSGDVEIFGGASCEVSSFGSGEVTCNGQEVDG